MSEAEILVGSELRLPSSGRTVAGGTFHHHELIGCEVRDRSDALLGRVSRWRTHGAKPARVQGKRGETQIPMTANICISIDPAASRIVVDPPEGLLDLNVTSRSS